MIDTGSNALWGIDTEGVYASATALADCACGHARKWDGLVALGDGELLAAPRDAPMILHVDVVTESAESAHSGYFSKQVFPQKTA